ncbi:MAG TPA: HDOD domain-containing protein [Steroidobacteraceae bacterium]|jgi:HD-like signal output (HDOD) protein|nr:HDOD domain-containing protein [Steroidobacteraceae bacterium]
MSATVPQADALVGARQEIARLSSLPVMDGRLLKIMGEPEAGSQYEQLGTLLHADPALAARVLKVANSAFFGGARAIDSIKRALDVLGTAAVTGIAMAASLDGTVSQLGTAHLGFFEQLRQHSLITAVAARQLTLRRPVQGWTPDAAFVLGLVHDLGWLVQLQLKSDSQVSTIGAPTALDHLVRPPPPEAGHALLGAALFSYWGLPPEFSLTVLNHHGAVRDDSTPGHQLLAVADRCAHFHHDRLPEGEPAAACELPLHEFQMTAETLPQFASQMAAEALLIGKLVRK